MKRFVSIYTLLFVAIIVQIIAFPQMSFTNAPSAALWFQQTGYGFDSLSKEYSIQFSWQDGLIDANHPKAEGYKLYRSMVGHDEELANFDLVGTIETSELTGEIKYSDKMMHAAGYFYYLRGYANGELGEISTVITACSPGAYCVNLDAEIIDITTFPSTIGLPGDLYSYSAFAKHRSSRVQGFVRYLLLENPLGMTLDEKTGLINWNIPSNASGKYFVKFKAYSLEDSRAESIQEWYIRIANNEEIVSKPSSVIDYRIINQISIYPNPAKDYIFIQPSEDSIIQIYDMLE